LAESNGARSPSEARGFTRLVWAANEFERGKFQP
jgi:hypothetical protein